MGNVEPPATVPNVDEERGQSKSFPSHVRTSCRCWKYALAHLSG